MTKEFLFVRHGESIANKTRTISNNPSDYAPLTELGKTQTKELLENVRHREISAIYSSPIMRARETAEIVGKELGIEVKIEYALREPFCGEIEGRSDHEAWEKHAKQEKAWRNGNIDYSIPGGESLKDVINRFVPSIQNIVMQHTNHTGNIMLVSHGSILRAMLPRILENISTKFTHSNPLQNCSFVTVASTYSGLICTEWNGMEYSDPNS